MDAASMMAEMERMKAEMEKMKKENNELKNKVKAITFKVSEKGALSVYGLNARFPVTLYKNQWERLIEKIDEMKEFIVENEDKLIQK